MEVISPAGLSFRLHKAILASGSDFFRACFSVNCREVCCLVVGVGNFFVVTTLLVPQAAESRLVLQVDDRADLFGEVVQFIYGGDPPRLDEGRAVGASSTDAATQEGLTIRDQPISVLFAAMLALSRALQVTRLELHCLAWVETNLAPGNALDLLHDAVAQHLEDIQLMATQTGRPGSAFVGSPPPSLSVCLVRLTAPHPFFPPSQLPRRSPTYSGRTYPTSRPTP